MVGCATGEEAYSLAILLLEEAEQLKVSVPIQIFATDLDEGALATAREGRYPRSIEADVSAERLKRFFIDEGTHYRINRQVRDLVLFATHSVVREPPFMRLDLITCRNVLIYLERALQQHVNTIFRYGLKMGGYLFLGPAETADTTDNHFVVVDRDARIYRAAPARPDFVSTLSPPGPWSASRPALTESRLAAARLNASEVLGESHAAALEASAPPSALVDAEQGVLHLSPSVGRFVLLSAGPLSGRLPNIVRPELRLDLKLALDRAFDARQPTITRPLDVAMEGDTRRVSLHVAPLPIDQGAAPRAIVYFLDSGPGRTEADGDSVAPTDELQHLHNELKVAQEAELAGRLRNESAVQELRASNEELQSLNEEYRSTAEELETSKEELQSINEELQTVNAELKSKLGIISEAHNDLQNLTASSEIGTLFLDLDLRIRMFTPPIADLINVAKADVGRPITNFTHRLEYDDIVADVRRVLRDLKSFESEMRTVDGRWFVVRIRPYRTLDGKVEGAVVTFDDNTGRRLAREALRQSEQIRDLALAAAEMGTWDYDLVADVWRFDARAQAMYSLPSDTLDHRPDGVAAMVHPDDTSPMFDAIKRASDIDGDGRYEIDYRIARGDGSYRWLRAWGKAEIEIVGAGRRAVRIVGASRDVTAEKDAETALRESEARHRLLIGSWAQAVWETDANGLVIADSPSWRAHTGQTLDEWLGYGWLDAIHPDDREHAERQWRETVGVQGLVSTEFRLRAPDGEWRWTNMRAARVLDGEGRIAKWAGMNIDIDAHKRAEAMSRESEARYQALFAASPVPFMVLAPNAPDFTITAANDAYLAATFTTREGLIGRRLFDVFTDDPSRTGQLGSEALDISLTRVLTTRRTDTMDKVRYDIVTPSGKFKEHWWLALNAPVLDSSGQITAIIQQVSRVTDEYHADAALRESEKKYRDLFERIDEAFCIIEIIFDQTEKAVDYRFIEVNPAFEAHTGIADAKGLLMRDIAPSHEQHWFDYYGHVARTGESLRLEAPAKALDDRYFAFHAFRVGHPEQHRVAVVFSDITQQQRAAVALRDSEERLRNFGEASQDVLWVRDADTLDWTYLTPAFEEVYGLSRDDALKGDNFRNWLELIVAADRDHARASIDRVVGGELVTFEYRIRRPIDGEVRWLRDTDFPMRDDQGQVVSIGGIGQDVTFIKTAEHRLRASELWQQLLIEGVPQLVWRAFDGGKWTWASPQWTDYTGQAEADSHGYGWLDPVHPDDRERVRKIWADAIERGEYHAEYRICHESEQRYRWFQSRATPVRDDAGDIVEWLGTSTDVDDLRQLQERQGVLVAELQHRTRNLITVVRAVAQQTVRDAASLEDFRDRFGDRLSALSRVQGLLSHLSAGRRVTFDDLLGSELAALGALEDRVTLEGPADVPLRSATVQTFSLALHELATNALKYGALAAAHGRLTVRWEVTAAANGASRLKVDWRESGVDMTHVGDRPQGGGYGRELIEQALPYQLGAKTSYEMTQDGIHCIIDVPTSDATA